MRYGITYITKRQWFVYLGKYLYIGYDLGLWRELHGYYNEVLDID